MFRLEWFLFNFLNVYYLGKTLDKLFKGANSKCNKEKDTDEQVSINK